MGFPMSFGLGNSDTAPQMTKFSLKDSRKPGGLRATLHLSTTLCATAEEGVGLSFLFLNIIEKVQMFSGKVSLQTM